MARERVQITLVQLAMQAHVSSEASQICVDGILVPVDTMLRRSRLYGNTSKVTIQAKLDISLWNNDPSRHLRRAVFRAQDELIFESKHGAARLKFINDVAGHASALQF